MDIYCRKAAELRKIWMGKFGWDGRTVEEEDVVAHTGCSSCANLSEFV